MEVFCENSWKTLFKRLKVSFFKKELHHVCFTGSSGHLCFVVNNSQSLMFLRFLFLWWNLWNLVVLVCIYYVGIALICLVSKSSLHFMFFLCLLSCENDRKTTIKRCRPLQTLKRCRCNFCLINLKWSHVFLKVELVFGGRYRF